MKKTTQQNQTEKLLAKYLDITAPQFDDREKNYHNETHTNISISETDDSFFLFSTNSKLLSYSKVDFEINVITVGFKAFNGEPITEGAVFSVFNHEAFLYEVTAVNNGRDFQIRRYNYRDDSTEILVPTLGLPINLGSRIEIRFDVPLDNYYPSVTGPLAIYAKVDNSDYVLLEQNLIDLYGLSRATVCLGTRGAGLGLGIAAQGMEIEYVRGFLDTSVVNPDVK